MNQSSAKEVRVRYFAALKAARGEGSETVTTKAGTVDELYRELAERHRFTLEPHLVKAAVGDEFVPPETRLEPGMEVLFMPPMAGG